MKDECKLRISYGVIAVCGERAGRRESCLLGRPTTNRLQATSLMPHSFASVRDQAKRPAQAEGLPHLAESQLPGSVSAFRDKLSATSAKVRAL